MRLDIYRNGHVEAGFHLGFPLMTEANEPAPEQVLETYDDWKKRRKRWKRFDYRYSRHMMENLGHPWFEEYRPYPQFRVRMKESQPEDIDMLSPWSRMHLDWGKRSYLWEVALNYTDLWCFGRKNWKRRSSKWIVCAINNLGGEVEVRS